MQNGRRVYKSERDHPAFKIFNWLFEIFVPQAFTIDLAVADQFGTPTTGDRAYDGELARENTRVMWPISKMAMKANDGCPIVLAKPADATKIHGLIMEYLEVWAEDMELELNYLTPEEVKGNPKYIQREKDMELLEAFAEIVHPVAKSQIPVAMRANSLGARLRALGSRITDNRDKTTHSPTVAVDAPTALSANVSGGSSRGAKRWR